MFDIDKIVTALKTDPNAQRTAGAGAAGLAAGMLLGGGGMKKIAKYGALAAIGGIAYNAWQKSRTPDQSANVETPPPGPFMPAPENESEQESLGKALVRAMIAAAKADGRIDADEKEKIFARLEGMDLSPQDKAFVFDELSSPLDMEAVVRAADTPEHAAEIYAASLVAIEGASPGERAYLAALSHRLSLPADLVTSIHETAGK
ncbi:tellurite resistance TerB family protein [Pelagibacterium montanilacus]|uniref:tellurite resistance TerB family protein n=1 Tax=Pelagibacterium montanilacus TaxID=2185280 RepID=UPI000F8E4DFF|nr:tellurite resistance TerB family protein [Pelagibacterium montanilacus]